MAGAASYMEYSAPLLARVARQGGIRRGDSVTAAGWVPCRDRTRAPLAVGVLAHLGGAAAGEARLRVHPRAGAPARGGLLRIGPGLGRLGPVPVVGEGLGLALAPQQAGKLRLLARLASQDD